MEALALASGIEPPDPMRLISLRTTLGKLAGLRGDLKLMEDMHRLNLKERLALVGPDSARVAVDWNNLAAVALRRDSFAEADAAYAEALRVIALDPQSPESRQAWLRGGRGFALTGLGRFAEARAELEAAIEIAQRTLHAQHPIIASMRIGMSSLERYQGNLDAAAAEAKRARDIFDPLNHPDQASAEWQLALVRLEQRRDVEALQVLIRAERHFAERRNREEALYWLGRVGLGLAQLRTGDDRGRALMEEALAAVKERAQPPSSTLADAYALAASAADQRKDLL
jgi:tetratricopeptide (TPR) repeat protein